MKRVNTRTLLATLLLLCCNVAAAYNFEVDGIYYNIIDFSGKAVEGTNNGANNSYKGQVVIPESVEYYGTIYRVTSIGEDALSNCGELTSVVIPASVTTIRRYAFNYSKILSSIVIPNSVTTIEEGTFRGSGIKSIEIPASITTIKENAFESCNNLTSINIPDNVTEIGEECFRYCSKLAEVTIGNGITTIAANAFYGCSELRSITIPANITTIEDYAFYACSNLARVTLGSGVTSIGDNAFSYCDRLKLIYNYSELSLSKGWDDYGNVAINAIVIITPDDEEQYHFDGNYLFKSTDGKNTLVLYTGKLISQISLLVKKHSIIAVKLRNSPYPRTLPVYTITHSKVQAGIKTRTMDLFTRTIGCWVPKTRNSTECLLSMKVQLVLPTMHSMTAPILLVS